MFFGIIESDYNQIRITRNLYRDDNTKHERCQQEKQKYFTFSSQLASVTKYIKK